jgi:hypothetical protein
VATIKEQLLATMQQHADSRGRVSLTPDALGKRHGLSGHDLVKNLEQLKQEGLLTITWKADRVQRLQLRRGALNESLLRQRKPALSGKDRVTNWLLGQPTGPGGWVETNPGAIQAALGVNGHGIPVAISEMQRSGRLQVRKAGARIVAIRFASLGASGPQRPAEEPSTPVPTALPDTPLLRQYIQARRFANLAPTANPYISVDFKEDPMAEEAILLLKALEGEPNRD